MSAILGTAMFGPETRHPAVQTFAEFKESIGFQAIEVASLRVNSPAVL
jgi:hypothetical protein